MSSDSISIHLHMATYNSAGMVFANTELKVVVIRWISQASFGIASELVQLAHDEMEKIGSDALIFDMRKIPRQLGQPTCRALAQKCLASPKVKRWATIGGRDVFEKLNISPDTPPEVNARGVKLFVTNDFAKAAAHLDTEQTNPEGPWLAKDIPSNFWGTYGGVIYSLPEYSCTVFRSTGNTLELPLALRTLAVGGMTHKKSGATVAIMDSRSSPPILEPRLRVVFYEVIVMPLTKGDYKQIIHIRTGESLLAEGSVPVLSPLLLSFNVPYFEVPSMEEAVKILRLLKGKPGQVVPPVRKDVWNRLKQKVNVMLAAALIPGFRESLELAERLSGLA